ncbi:MAG TPA: hypothetical protein P5348_01415 [Bacteroidales bacterium]|nr:hypothetical protein [Bacteroidales bacterium]HRR92619.1 hypothetical protein [Bacteroidales bacterium]
MKKISTIVTFLLVAVAFAGTLSATTDKSANSDYSSSPLPSEREIKSCYDYFDNPWTGSQEITDCLYCLPKMVDNPRYPFKCYGGIE